MYFATDEFYDLIRDCGGEWNDKKERPLVCLLKFNNEDIYWAIPVGNWNHRDDKAKDRIISYINKDKKQLSSCFYHIGNTTVKSIFFISDAVPISDKYIKSEYLGYDDNIYIISNNKLKEQLLIKLKRILRQEELHPNYFRQHITDIKNKLIQEQN